MSGVTAHARIACALSIALLLLAPGAIDAQIPGRGAGTPGPSRPATRTELRLDAFSADIDALHLGGAVAFPAGTYLRIAAVAGAGVARANAEDDAPSETGFSARAELLARFHLDPLRQSRWGPYAEGGVGIRSDFDERRGYVALLLGIEGRSAWAFEVGFGNGVRAAVVLRGGSGPWR